MLTLQGSYENILENIIVRNIRVPMSLCTVTRSL